MRITLQRKCGELIKRLLRTCGRERAALGVAAQDLHNFEVYEARRVQRFIVCKDAMAEFGGARRVQ